MQNHKFKQFCAFLMIALLFTFANAHAGQNNTPTKFSRQIELSNKVNRYARNANNDDFQKIITGKNRRQRGDDNARGRRGKQPQAVNDYDERTQSKNRLENTDRKNRYQNKSRNNNSGRRGQNVKINNSGPGLND